MFEGIISINSGMLYFDVIMAFMYIYAFWKFRHAEKDWRCLLCAFLFIVCYGWRVVFGIITSRYALTLIMMGSVSFACFLYFTKYLTPIWHVFLLENIKRILT